MTSCIGYAHMYIVPVMSKPPFCTAEMKFLWPSVCWNHRDLHAWLTVPYRGHTAWGWHYHHRGITHYVHWKLCLSQQFVVNSSCKLAWSNKISCFCWSSTLAFFASIPQDNFPSVCSILNVQLSVLEHFMLRLMDIWHHPLLSLIYMYLHCCLPSTVVMYF